MKKTHNQTKKAVRCALIVMTRVPIPGKTKTRLISSKISASQAADLHYRFLQDLNLSLQNQQATFDLTLFIGDEGPKENLLQIFKSQRSLLMQPQGDLGFRMGYAFETHFRDHYDKVVLIGSDIPQIAMSDINLAFEALDQHDLVFGPTTDGGYYLIGMKEPLQLPFSNKIQWGTSSAFTDSIRQLQDHYRVTQIRSLFDIDNPEDLVKLYETTKDCDLCFNTRVYIEQHLTGLFHE